MVPETTTAFNHYRQSLSLLAASVRHAGGQVVGHGHPRSQGRLRATWRSLGIPFEPDLATIFDTASVLVADNTSAMYEFASLDRPVICLNAPWYRRDVEHGLRFWSHVPGVQADTPDEMIDRTLEALADPSVGAEDRARATAYAYTRCDGRASERAAAAIVEVL